jgi:hypothetical protein
MSILEAAYHEAGHCVARARCGRALIAAEIRADGSGLTHGDGKRWRMHNQYEVWDYLVYVLAGSFAEARRVKKGRFAVSLGGGRDDYTCAREKIDRLVSQGYASSQEAAWARAEDETSELVRSEWAAIERVAMALISQRRLGVGALRRLIELR